MLMIILLSLFSCILKFCSASRSVVFVSMKFGDNYSVQRTFFVREVPKTRITSYLNKYNSDIFPTITSAKKTVRKGIIYINNIKATTETEVETGDIIELYARISIKPNRVPIISLNKTRLMVAWEDNELAVIVKPQGMPVFRTAGSKTEEGTVQNSVLQSLKPFEFSNYCFSNNIIPLRRPKLVHRLDQGTGGLIIAAKTQNAIVKLSEDFANRRINKTYRAILAGSLLKDEGTVEIDVAGKSAFTSYNVVERSVSRDFGMVTTIDLKPTTGRYHQLRRHMAFLKHPIIGDPKYFDRALNCNTNCETDSNSVKSREESETENNSLMMLWCLSLEFIHPSTNEVIVVSLPEPEVFREYREQQKKL